jgi:hypothetical protein
LTQINPIIASRNTGATVSSTVRAIVTDCFRPNHAE